MIGVLKAILECTNARSPTLKISVLLSKNKERSGFFPEATTPPRILGILTLHLLICWDILSSGNSYLPSLKRASLTLAWAGQGRRGKKLTNGRWEAFRGGYHVSCQGNCWDLHFMPSSLNTINPFSHVHCLVKCFTAWDITIGQCHEMTEEGDAITLQSLQIDHWQNICANIVI